MQQEPNGIAFHETMAGPFALDVTDPQAGADKGKTSGSTMKITCAITIPDLEHFLADPAHTGQIAGQLSSSLFGDNLSAKSGIFNLFSPTNDPGCKYMIYELAFAAQGQDYYLAGHKNVRNNPAYDLWRDTTTLYTQLHRGEDKTGPVVGAGILTIDLGELTKMIASMHATNAHTIAGQSGALYTFGRFFLGELWETYGPGAKRENNSE